MAVLTTSTSIAYYGDGSATAFTVPFKFLADNQLSVTLGGTPLTLTTDYMVAGAGEDAGGTVTLHTAPDSGARLFIERVTPTTQNVSFRGLGTFSPAVHETAFDKAMMVLQEFGYWVDKAFNERDAAIVALDELRHASLKASATIETDGLGGAVIRGGLNVTSVSIVDGKYIRLTYDSAFPSNLYQVLVTASVLATDGSVDTAPAAAGPIPAAKTTSTVDLYCYLAAAHTSTANNTAFHVCVAIFDPE